MYSRFTRGLAAMAGMAVLAAWAAPLAAQSLSHRLIP